MTFDLVFEVVRILGSLGNPSTSSRGGTLGREWGMAFRLPEERDSFMGISSSDVGGVVVSDLDLGELMGCISWLDDGLVDDEAFDGSGSESESRTIFERRFRVGGAT